MDNNKTLIIMIILTAVFFFTIMFLPKKKQSKNIENLNIEKIKKIEKKEDKKKEIEVEKEKEDSDFEYIEIPQGKSYNLIYENSKIKIEFTPYDAMIKKAIVKYKNVDLVDSINVDDGALRLKLGSWDKELTLSKIINGNNKFYYERIGNTFTFKFKFRKINEDIIYTIEKKYTFIDNEHIFKLETALYNDKKILSKFDDSNFTYSIGWGPSLGINSRKKQTNKRQENIFSYFNGEKLVKVKQTDKMFKKNKTYNSFTNYPKDINSSWVASNGHYFASIIYPDKKEYTYFFDYRDNEKKNYYCGFSREGNSYDNKSRFYILLTPKIDSELKKYDDFDKKGFKLENSFLSKIRYKPPIIGVIRDVIQAVLNFIYKIIPNYGVAIILITILIKIVLFPLTFKSMKSQQKMSKIQPKIKEVQEKYKGNPEQLNKETLKLYKKEGVNPLGGCLPMLLQMPIFIAMYGLLNNMVELKDASFIWWINDLSTPDSVIEFIRPIPIVKIYSLNILPFVMVGMQLLSSIFMPDVKTNKQAKMMMWMMPLIFFFILYNVASGLVLYWTVMNVLNLVQQIYMNKIKNKSTA